MTVQQFESAAGILRNNGVALRVFILVKPPFQTDDEAWKGCRRSIEFAFNCGATVVSLIPTRLGNGALEALAERGEFRPPTLELLEAAVEYGIHLTTGRVFADLWDVEKFSTCPGCLGERTERLERINLTQQLEPPVNCALCDYARNRQRALLL
jgi:uncharacterized Fe-S cluster-containing MiaB family protein